MSCKLDDVIDKAATSWFMYHFFYKYSQAFKKTCTGISLDAHIK